MVEDTFDDIWIVNLFSASDGNGQRPHVCRRIFSEDGEEIIDVLGVDHRFISLDIEYGIIRRSDLFYGFDHPYRAVFTRSTCN